MSATSLPGPGHDRVSADPLAPPLAGPARAAELAQASIDWPSVTLTPAQLADLELLLLGAFGPVPGYPENTDADGVRVPSLVLPASDAPPFGPGDPVALRDAEGVMIAALVLRTAIPEPDGAGTRLVGTLEGVRLPHHPDHPELRLTPAQLRTELHARGWDAPGAGACWAVWADGLLHTADVGRIRALTRQGKRCVVLAPVGGADPADAGHHLRIRCLLAALDAVDAAPRASEATLASASLASDAVTREGAAGWRAEPPPDPYPRPGSDEHPPDHRSLLVLVPVIPSAVLATPREPGMSATVAGGAPPESEAFSDSPPSARPAAEVGELTALRSHLAAFYGLAGSLIGPAIGTPGPTELASLLDAGGPIPAELTPPAVAAELARAIPPRSERGLTVFFTGLSGSGKSTLAGLLVCRLLERGGRRVTLLDGDVVRTHLSAGLGFSRADRDTNVRRIGFVAGQVAGAGGTAVCAPIAPYAEVRGQVRDMVHAAGGGFVLVHVSTPLEVCESRDRKGLYAKARAGVLPAFTGISDPYEAPTDADVTVNTAELSTEEAVTRIINHLRRAGWLGPT